ncbi:MAG: IS110 family transposase [Gammaproteobacteria bacterium]|nr:IS110 family transposase [Gammaproteobacteria bacterium]
MDDNGYEAYIGLDVHKDTIAVAIAPKGRKAPEFLGEIPNDPSAVRQLVHRLGKAGEALNFCYEAGPCGYQVYWQIRGLGCCCEVVAPGLIPRKPGDRIKTDRRDALKLARLHRAGELTAVWVPEAEQEAMRDLTRAREDAKADEQRARQRLNNFLLRHGRKFEDGKSKWTKTHFRWLETQKFEWPHQQVVFQEYLDTVRERQTRTAGLLAQMQQALRVWSLRPMAEAFMALRGIDLITAMTLLAELGDLSRFDHPKRLMAYLGLTPSEHSSGGRQQRGGITKSGNSHARRGLVEAAWAYRFPARKTAHLQKRLEGASPAVQQIAWAAQKRLCGRYRKLTLERGKPKQKVCTAVARELAGFLWALSREISGQPYAMRTDR